MLSRLFKRNASCAVVENQPISMECLDQSFEMLKTATVQVSQEAVKTARVLEEKLRDSEFRFLSIADSIEDVVVLKNGEGRWTMVNKFGRDVMGFKDNEYFMKTDQELMDMFPHLKETFAICQMTDKMAWMSKKPYRAEESIPSEDMHYHLDMVKTPVFNDDGSRKELIIVGRDITEVYEKRQRTRACFHALNAASDAIFIVDSNKHIFFCNDTFVELFQFGSYKDVTGKSICDVIPSINCTDDMWEILKNNNSWESDFEDFRLTVVPMMNGVPDPIYYVCTLKPNRQNR